MTPPRPAAGQASIEYVGLFSLLAVLLGVATAAAGPSSMAPVVVAKVRHVLCITTGGLCTPQEARSAGLDPCVVHSRADDERAEANVLLVRVGRGDDALVERRSDGSVAVSFADGVRAGADLGGGLKFDVAGFSALARASLGVKGTFGSTYEFKTAAAANAFLERYSGEETIKGEARNVARRLLPGAEARRLPRPDEMWWDGGGWFDGALEGQLSLPGISAPAGLDAELSGAAVVGRRKDGREERWTIRLTTGLTARLSAVLGSLGAERGNDAAMEMVFRDGVPVRLVARGSASAGGELALEGRARELGDLIAKLRGVTAGAKAGGQRGFVVDAAVSLDLTVPENLSATERFLELLVAAPTVEPNEWDDRVRTLADRVKDDGTVDVSLSRVTTTEDETGYSLPFFGAEHVRASRTHELLAAWSAIRGGPLRDREDCVPAGE